MLVLEVVVAREAVAAVEAVTVLTLDRGRPDTEVDEGVMGAEFDVVELVFGRSTTEELAVGMLVDEVGVGEASELDDNDGEAAIETDEVVEELTADDEPFALVDDVDDKEVVLEEADAARAALVVLYMYTLSRNEPPQNSLEFPLHSIVQPLSAGPPLLI